MRNKIYFSLIFLMCSWSFDVIAAINVTSIYGRDGEVIGSGFLFGSERECYLATAKHVVAGYVGAVKYKIKSSSEFFDADIYMEDDSDFAILKTKNDKCNSDYIGSIIKMGEYFKQNIGYVYTQNSSGFIIRRGVGFDSDGVYVKAKIVQWEGADLPSGASGSPFIIGGIVVGIYTSSDKDNSIVNILRIDEILKNNKKINEKIGKYFFDSELDSLSKVIFLSIKHKNKYTQINLLGADAFLLMYSILPENTKTNKFGKTKENVVHELKNNICKKYGYSFDCDIHSDEMEIVIRNFSKLINISDGYNGLPLITRSAEGEKVLDRLISIGLYDIGINIGEIYNMKTTISNLRKKLELFEKNKKEKIYSIKEGNTEKIDGCGFLSVSSVGLIYKNVEGVFDDSKYRITVGEMRESSHCSIRLIKIGEDKVVDFLIEKNEQ